MHHQLVHFPIAFLLTALVADVAWRLRGSDRIKWLRSLAMYAGAAGALFASVTGMVLSIGLHSYPLDVLYVHLGLGLACTASAAAAALSVRYDKPLPATIATFVAACLVSAAGVWGGMLGHP